MTASDKDKNSNAKEDHKDDKSNGLGTSDSGNGAEGKSSEEQGSSIDGEISLPDVSLDELAEELSCIRRQLDASKLEANDYKDRYVRALAEFDNYKKRALKERSDLLKYQGEKIFLDILEVVDNLELALTYESSDPDKLKAGLELVYKRFIEILNRWEVRGESGLGKEFNPNIHSAISKINKEGAKPGSVIEELKRTYFYKDKLLRFGEVVVADSEGGEQAKQ